MAFVAWTPISGRQAEVAAALGGEAAVFYRLGRAPRWTTPLRYALSAAETAAYLIRRRPRAVIATNPPIFPGWLALAFGRLARAPVLLDSHPGGFGLQGDRASRALQPLHRWLARRATTTLVADGRLAERVDRWGGQADIVHEAPIEWGTRSRRDVRARPRILFVCIFQRDEPVAEVIEAARRCPELDVHVTGEVSKCPPALRRTAPPNVRFTGFLVGDDYRTAVLDADIVLALTTEPSSVVRAGYEAVYAERPLVVSDWPASRAVFPHALHVRHDPKKLAEGLRRAVSEHAQLSAVAVEARALQRSRWQDQLRALKRRLTDTPTPDYA